MVVSVTSTRVCSRIQAAKPCGPSRSSRGLVPLAGSSVGCEVRRLGQPRVAARAGAAGDLGVAVDGDVADIGQELGRPVAPLAQLEQLGRLVDEAGRVLAGEEAGMLEQRLEEGEVGGDAADPVLAQGPVHARDRLLGRGRPGGDLLQHRVVVAGDHGTRVGGAAVDPDAEAEGAAIGGDPAIVGDEVVLGVLGGDPALQRVAVEAHRVLGRDAGLGERADTAALGDPDLRLHDVEAGHDLGHRVLDLDARVDLDEVEGARVGIHQELDRAGADIVGGAADLERRLAQGRPPLLVEIGGRRPLDHLLVAALDGAVALEQVDQVAVGVAQQLDLDVPRAADQLLEVDLVLAEGGLGLAPRREHGIQQLLLAVDRPHATTAAAPGGLEHHRVADLGREPLDGGRVVGQAGRWPA